MQHEQLIGYAEAADLLSISRFTLRKYVSRGVVPYVKIGRSVRFSPSRLQQWVGDHTVDPSEEEVRYEH